ncbi:MAG: CHRD domain-containing protein [Planctomycetota bacterium]|nr:MAG: CHRD domain-containing protein [Planctomycetota bacterium]
MRGGAAPAPRATRHTSLMRSSIRHAALVLALAVSSAAAAPLAAQTLELSSCLGAAFVAPPNASQGFGSFDAQYDAASGLLTCSLSVVGTSATTAHVHRGLPGQNSTELFTLTGSGSFLSGSTQLDAATAADLLAGGLYVDAHSAAFPTGELRGQIQPRRFFHAEPTGQQVVAPVVTNASARAWITLDPASKRATLGVLVKDTTATAVEWHRGAAGLNGPLLLALNGLGSAWTAQSAPLPFSDLVELLGGRTYLLVKSATFPQGELRDQIEAGGLNANGAQISASRGGRVELYIDAGFEHGGRPYLVLGSLSGTFPGLSVDGLALPLNVDAYFNTTLAAPNQPPLSNSFSFLGLFGQGQASLLLPPGAASPVIGFTAYHALAVVDVFGSGKVAFTSNATPLAIVP